MRQARRIQSSDEVIAPPRQLVSDHVGELQIDESAPEPAHCSAPARPANASGPAPARGTRSHREPPDYEETPGRSAGRCSAARRLIIRCPSLPHPKQAVEGSRQSTAVAAKGRMRVKRGAFIYAEVYLLDLSFLRRHLHRPLRPEQSANRRIEGPPFSAEITPRSSSKN